MYGQGFTSRDQNLATQNMVGYCLPDKVLAQAGLTTAWLYCILSKKYMSVYLSGGFLIPNNIQVLEESGTGGTDG